MKISFMFTKPPKLQSVLLFRGWVLLIVLPFYGSNAASPLYKPPQIVEGLKTKIELKLGNFNRFVLKCRGNADPLPAYQWYKNNQPFSPNSSDSKGITLMSDDKHSQLDFSNPSPHHEGYYYCEATNTLGKARSTVSHVAPSFPAPPEGSIAPAFVKAPKTEMKSIGSRVELNCEADGTPTPSISWTKNGETLQSASTESSLIIPNLSQNDVANYACNASNIAGYQYKNVIISILTVVARIKDGPQKQMVANKGSDVSMLCEAEGYPKPNISWTVNGTVIGDSDKFRVDTVSGELMVKHVTVEDGGEYKCRAINHGEDTAEGYLIVYSKECPDQPQWIFQPLTIFLLLLVFVFGLLLLVLLFCPACLACLTWFCSRKQGMNGYFGMPMGDRRNHTESNVYYTTEGAENEMDNTEGQQTQVETPILAQTTIHKSIEILDDDDTGYGTRQGSCTGTVNSASETDTVQCSETIV